LSEKLFKFLFPLLNGLNIQSLKSSNKGIKKSRAAPVVATYDPAGTAERGFNVHCTISLNKKPSTYI